MTLSIETQENLVRPKIIHIFQIAIFHKFQPVAWSQYKTWLTALFGNRQPDYD